MAKTLVTLIKEAENITDETFDNALWTEWFNRGIDDLAEAAYLDGEAVITSATGIFTLPADFISAVTVTGSSGILYPVPPTDTTSSGYRIKTGSIHLQNDSSTSITLYYVRRAAYLATAASSTPVDLPDLYTRALVYFAARESMLREDETERYSLFDNEYQRAKVAIFKASRKRKSGTSGQWQVVR